MAKNKTGLREDKEFVWKKNVATFHCRGIKIV